MSPTSENKGTFSVVTQAWDKNPEVSNPLPTISFRLEKSPIAEINISDETYIENGLTTVSSYTEFKSFLCHPHHQEDKQTPVYVLMNIDFSWLIQKDLFTVWANFIILY